MKTKSKVRIHTHEIIFNWGNIFRGGLTILASLLMIGMGIAIVGLAINATYNDFEVFNRNHDDCIVSEIFTQDECYDIAYATAFGE